MDLFSQLRPNCGYKAKDLGRGRIYVADVNDAELDICAAYGYLCSLPLDYLKIDGGLVWNIVHESCDRAIVDLVNQVAHMMHMCTIAECIENGQIIKQRQQLDVDYAQGYAVGEITRLELV